MSAVPGNILNFSDFVGSGNDPSVMGWGSTQSTDYSVAPLSDGIPDNVVNTPRSDGVTWTGVLNGVSSTADSIFQTFGKVYQLQSDVESAKFNRTVQQAQLDLQRAQALGTLDIQKSAVDANVTIEKARAARATNDALARVNSGNAGYIIQNGKVSPMLILGGVAVIAAVMFFRKGK